jgi:hypothetical protein
MTMNPDRGQPVEVAEPAAGRHRWPWFLLAAFVVMLLPAGFWMKKEVGRARLLRDHGAQPAATNPGAITNPPAANR